MNILVTGATGCVARHFVWTMLTDNPDLQFTLLTRHPDRAKRIYHKQLNSITIIDEIDEKTPVPDVILNLAGSPIVSGSFSFRLYGEIESSRIDYTARLCHKLKKLGIFPRLFISASAAGIYRESELVHTELSTLLGGDYIANLAMSWENSVWEGCKKAPTRTVLLRLGNIIASDSSFFERMKRMCDCGLGFKLKGTPVHMPWIDMKDVVSAIAHIIKTPEIKGPVNLTSPQDITINDFSQLLATAQNKRLHVTVPKSCIRLSQGRVSPAILKSLVVEPLLLKQTGFVFSRPDIREAIASAINKDADS